MMKLRQYHFSWLVAMAAGVAMTAMTACSSEKELTETPIVEQPAQPTAKGVKVTVTAGISDGAQTRSAVTEGTDAQGKTTRTLKFTGPKGTEGQPGYEPGDRLYIHGEIYDNFPDKDKNPDYDPDKEETETVLYGFLDIDPESISADGTSATFSGTLHTFDTYTHDEDAYDFKGEDPLAMCNFTKNEDYGEPAHAVLVHSGTKEGSYDIDYGRGFRYNPEDMFADDVETLMTTALFVMGRYDKQTHGFSLSADYPILNCTLSGLDANHDYTATLTSEIASGYNPIVTYNIHTDADGDCAFAISTYFKSNMHRYITIKDGNTVVGTIDLGTRELTAKVYNVKRNYGKAAFGKFVDISTLTADFEAQDGDVLTGTLGGEHKISIAAGAMVTLDGVTINDNGNVTDNNLASDDYRGRRWENGKYAGLTCLGSATVILKDGSTNTVRGFYNWYPGIQAGPSGTTLIIRGGSQGTGQLFASGVTGAGIGAEGTCGDITIEGGTVNAASFDGAGIGAGAEDSTCGNISINGGSITAKSYGEGGAGIGSASVSTCGDISITGSPSVNATGTQKGAGIGSGGGLYSYLAGTCGTIDISLTGGSVTAKGGAAAAGIGTGRYGTCGSIKVERNPAASTQFVTVTADRNNGNRANGCYDIGKGANGTIKDGENNGTVSVGSNVRTSGGMSYYSNSSDGYNH